jgi:pimeloyl-ACP methyl ester carboxylesterase
MPDPTTTSHLDAWRAAGAYFSWSPPEAGAATVRIFHVELGPPDAPVLALVHGFPTCSIDWFEVAGLLAGRFRVCLLDFPGYGFSDKPRGWGYSLRRDAELLDYYLAEVVGVRSADIVAHDRGDSVALIHVAIAASGQARIAPRHLVLSNANMYLPLANLTDAQRLMLHDPEWLERVTPDRFAAGIGGVMFTPPRDLADPQVQALAAAFAHNDGITVLGETIHYLVERSVDEDAWLRALASRELPTTLIWGINDTVAPVRVATHIWHEHLMFKPGQNALYLVPRANHYVQNDRPEAFVETVLHALSPPDGVAPGAISAAVDASVLVDRSRAELADAAAVVAQRPTRTPPLDRSRQDGAPT